MQYNSEKLPGEPITVFTLDEKWSWADSPNADALLRGIWSAEKEPCYHIVHVVIHATVEDYQRGFSDVAYGPQALFKHPNLKLVFFVGPDPGLGLAVEGIQSAGGVFEKLPVPVRYVPTLDEALTCIREQRGK